MTTLHQFVATFEPGATATHLLEVRRLAHEQGWESEVFAEHVRPVYSGLARPHRDYGTRRMRARSSDVLVYQMGIGSAVADYLVDRRETLVVNYHNLTPESFYATWAPEVVWGLTWGRDQLRTLSERAALGIAVSRFNEQDLTHAGFRATAVAPFLLDPDRQFGSVDEAAAARLHDEKRRGGADWLFVGRVVPNKRHEDLVKAFAVYRRVYDPHARLHLVGGQGPRRYQLALERFVAALGLEEAVRFARSADDATLAAHYATADVFVCLSQHEGFCVPIVEAWHHDLPVVAYAAAAVPETLGPAGLLLHENGAAHVAAAVARVLSDDDVRKTIVTAGRTRLEQFSLARSRARFLDALRPVLP